MARRRTAYVAVLAALFLNVPVVAGTIATAAAAQYTPTDDSYVQATRADTNFGSRNAMRVDATPDRVAYVMFDLAGSTPGSATLQVNVESNGDGLDLYAVADTTWDESTITYNNAPPTGALLGSITGGVTAGVSYYFDISSHVTGDGIYAFAIRTTDNTAIKLGTKEGGNAAIIHSPPPSSPSPYLVTRVGTTYTATSQTNGNTYTGTLKFAVESAVFDLELFGGGTVTFTAGTFDIGADHFEFDDISNIVFEGAGTDVTILTNNSSDADDTEPFDFVTAHNVTIRDMTISANGLPRSTSDAIDFDNGSNNTIERVHITASRGNGIVFDGKGAGWSATGNSVIDCQIDGIPGDGIELLASSNNTISGCTIVDVGFHGIQINKSSATAAQPNKQSNDNLITGNTIDDSGLDGINLNSSARNLILNNVITNSSDNVSNKDGIRLSSNNGITCDDNEVDGNVVTDNQVVKTQRYGLNISSAECHRTVVGANDFTGNKTGDINDLGTDTIYNLPPDTDPPSVPTGVTATALSHFEVDVTWNASTDNVGVTGYTVYRDGGVLATVGGTTLSYLDTTVAPETMYSYTVEAFDAAGNVSGQSAPSVVTTPPASGTITLNPTDDAYVDSSKPGNNYGNSSAIRIDGSPEKNAYFKFDVTGVTGSVASATLRIYAATGSSVGFDISQVADTTWTEGSITFNNAPAIGSLLGSSGSFSGGNYIEIDVTSYVTGNGAISFGMTTPHTTAIRFDSSEGTNAPELVIVQGP